MTDEEAEMLGYGAVFAAEDEETPLYTHTQLVEERRLAWNEANARCRKWLARCTSTTRSSWRI